MLFRSLLRMGIADTVDTACEDCGKQVDEALSDDEMDGVKRSADEIQQMLDLIGERALAKEADAIKEHLADAMLVRAMGQDDPVVYQRKLSDDEQVLAAVDVLVNDELYETLLSVEHQLEKERKAAAEQEAGAGDDAAK